METSVTKSEYLIGGVEAKEGTALSKDQLKAIQVDKINNPDKKYPDWVEKEYAARKNEVITQDKLVFAANKRVSSRSPHPPKTDKFAPKAQKEEKETPILTPKVSQGPKYSDVIPPRYDASFNASIGSNGSITRTNNFPSNADLEKGNQQYLNQLAAGNTEDGAVSVGATENTDVLNPPTNSSAERSGDGT